MRLFAKCPAKLAYASEVGFSFCFAVQAPLHLKFRGAGSLLYYKSMFYSYILKSKKDASYYYGSTDNIRRRLLEHNSGKVTYSKAHRPYEIVWYCVFPTKIQALAFEKYLKSSSGYAFSRKRLL